MVGEGDQTGTHAKDGEGLYLQVSGGVVDVRLVEGNVAVVLLVHVQVLHQSLLHQLLKLHPLREHPHVIVCHLRPSPLHHDVRPAYATSVRRDVDALLGVVGTDGNKLVHPPGPPQYPEHPYEVPVVLHDA